MKTNSLANDAIIDTVGSPVETASLKGWLVGLVAGMKRSMEERAVIRQIATLDNAMLRDIGVADDEIARVRRGEAFTPRAWR
jgi:uncharacterized protein YjiS (DUF1127 family)